MKQSDTSRTPAFGFIQGVYWVLYAVLMEYASPFLRSRGFTDTGIGLLVAVACLAAALLQPALTGWADKPRSPSVKRILTAMFALAALSCAVLTALPGAGVPVTAVLYCLPMILLQAALSLINALGTETLNQGYRLNIGLGRGMGSITFAVVAVLMGRLTERLGIGIVPPAALAVFLLSVVSAAVYPFVKQPAGRAQAAASMRMGAFFRKYPGYWAVMLGIALVYISHTATNTFLFQIMQSKGGGEKEMGVAVAVAAVAELPVMFLYDRLHRRASAGNLLMLSGVFFTAKMLLTALAPSVGAQYAVQVLQMGGYALYILSSIYYANERMQPEDRIKGQGMLTMASVVGSVAASVLCGRLLDTIGVQSMMYIATAAAAAGAAVMALGVLRGRRA